MTPHCIICDQELEAGEEHTDLTQCVRALVQYIKGSEKTLDDDLERLENNINRVENTADDALKTAESAVCQISEME
jgi:hypothetical protein